MSADGKQITCSVGWGECGECRPRNESVFLKTDGTVTKMVSESPSMDNAFIHCFLPTAYVVRRKVMFSHVSVHPSFCLSTGGVPRPGPDWGYPSQVQPGGTPQSDLARGGPCGGTPPQVPPLLNLAGGYLCQGVPTSGTPPSDLASGYPCQG